MAPFPYRRDARDAVKAAVMNVYRQAYTPPSPSPNASAESAVALEQSRMSSIVPDLADKQVQFFTGGQLCGEEPCGRSMHRRGTSPGLSADRPDMPATVVSASRSLLITARLRGGINGQGNRDAGPT